jgi:C-terminal processing protease CtpA/Prc
MRIKQLTHIIILLCFFPIFHSWGENRSIVFPKTGEPWCVIDDVIKSSQAEKLGLKPLDIVLAINGQGIHDRTTLSDLLTAFKGAEIQIDVFRGGQKTTISGRLEEARLGVYTNYVGKDKVVTPEEMKSDLDAFFSSLIEIHPKVYANFPESEFSTEKQRIYSQVFKDLTAIEFWKLVASFTAKIGDGHTSVELPGGNWDLDLYAGEKIVFPLIPFISKDGVFVRENLSSAPIQKGDLILAINGVPMEDILKTYEQYTSGELRHFRLRMIEWRFPRMLFCLHQFRGPFKVKTRNAQGNVEEFKVEGIDKWTYDSGTAARRDWDFHFEEVPELRTGIIRFNNFTNADHFNKFLETSFSTMEEKKYECLILDLQNNGGGDSSLAENLIEYVTENPYRFFGGAHIKIHNGVAKYFPEDEVGELKKYEDISFKTPKENDLRFKGKVYVLISNPTFSTASGFAAVIKDFNLGTLIGEETGGLPTCFGDVFSVQLPNSRLAVGISWKYFIRPSGNPEYVLRGIMPDVQVTTTGHDLILGLNPALEKAKDLIRDELRLKTESPPSLFSFEPDERLLTVYAFLNAAGYDREYGQEGMHPMRAEVRAAVENKLGQAFQNRISDFYQSHNPGNFRQYGAYGLLLSNPPEFRPLHNTGLQSEDNEYMAGLDELLREFYIEANVPGLWEKYAPELKEANEAYRPFGDRALSDIIQYCRLDHDFFLKVSKSFHFNVCPLMSHSTAWTAEIGGELYIISGPNDGPPGPGAFYHEALHHVINPLTAKCAQEVNQKKALLPLAQEQLQGNYPEWASVVNESFVRTIDQVLSGKHYGWSPDQTWKRIENEYKKGFILCPSIYEQLGDYEKCGDSMSVYYPILIQKIELEREKERWSRFWADQETLLK